VRKRIPKLSGDCSGFVHNALIHAGIHYRHEPSLPISEIARLNRECIARSLEPEEIDKSLAIIQELVKRGQGLHICEPLETSFTVVMWGAIWKDLDFQTVAIKEKPEAEPRKLEAFVLGQSGEPGAPRRCKLMQWL
jgi:hypothetical protein